jgi:glutamyl-tRNA synthetase
MKEIRVRFAPSPTGPLHIGGVRTALYNYLFARKHNGKFLLRIEDTDQNRYVPGAEEYIIEALTWCGIHFDEGVGIEGPHAPYRQSERKHLYFEYAEKLINEGKAYYAFDTTEELDAMRERLTKKGVATPQYDYLSRYEMKNSLVLPAEEVKQRLEAGEQYVIRCLIPAEKEIVVNDLIRGEVSVHSSRLDDKVLFKSDGMPTYHLANIVDDHLMEVTHVIRGEEWLPSAPLHVLLYEYFGWQAPEFAHLPLLLKPDGNGKLSKRDGDRLGFPVFPLRWVDPKSKEISSGYRESGYLPSAFVNMLALLGWNPGTEQEIFTMDELIESFSIDRVGKHGSKYDPEKAKWFNHHYLSSLSDLEIAQLLYNQVEAKGIVADMTRLIKIAPLIKDRITLIPDIWEQSAFFFNAPTVYDEKMKNKVWRPDTYDMLISIKKFINQQENLDNEVLEPALKEFIQQSGLNMGQVMNTIRLALVGSAFGPSIAGIISVLGKERTIERINLLINS